VEADAVFQSNPVTAPRLRSSSATGKHSGDGAGLDRFFRQRIGCRVIHPPLKPEQGFEFLGSLAKDAFQARTFGRRICGRAETDDELRAYLPVVVQTAYKCRNGEAGDG
jgi:hypothetical protein